MTYRTVICLIAAMPLTGCSILHSRGADDIPEPRTDYGQPAPQTNVGSIYQAGYDMSYFEDLKARRVGDIVTIRLVETTQASKSSSTSTSKEGSTSITAPTIAGRGVTANGTPFLGASLDGTREFQGAGSSNQSNSLEGSITVTVVKRLPNGNLVIEGDKWLTLNQGDEQVKIAGVIRPYDILPDNSVTSDKVAQARIRYSGRGALANSNKAGWLSRFFNSPLFPL